MCVSGLGCRTGYPAKFDLDQLLTRSTECARGSLCAVAGRGGAGVPGVESEARNGAGEGYRGGGCDEAGRLGNSSAR